MYFRRSRGKRGTKESRKEEGRTDAERERYVQRNFVFYHHEKLINNPLKQ